LEESERAEQAAYLPHLHARLSDVARQYPGETRLDSRLNAINALLAQRLAEERDKNLTRLILFRDGLDACDNPATLRDFHSLVTPISCSYAGDPAFEAVLDDIQSMYDTYENALSLMAENRTRESLRLCDQVLEQRNSNRLFLRLRERVKSREWVALLAESTVQRAHAFEQNGQYGEALEEWESLRTIDPSYPGLDSEILNCAALKERAGDFHSLPKETFLSEITETEPAAIEPPAFVDRSQAKALPLGFKIAITQDAWNHLKTGLAATIALLLVVLLLASNFRH
jgi:tetratricopeptide (TPR) repeat protein